jgi:hypothetical protein
MKGIAAAKQGGDIYRTVEGKRKMERRGVLAVDKHVGKKQTCHCVPKWHA